MYVLWFVVVLRCCAHLYDIYHLVGWVYNYRYDRWEVGGAHDLLPTVVVAVIYHSIHFLLSNPNPLSMSPSTYPPNQPTHSLLHSPPLHSSTSPLLHSSTPPPPPPRPSRCAHPANSVAPPPPVRASSPPACPSTTTRRTRPSGPRSACQEASTCR